MNIADDEKKFAPCKNIRTNSVNIQLKKNTAPIQICLIVSKIFSHDENASPFIRILRRKVYIFRCSLVKLHAKLMDLHANLISANWIPLDKRKMNRQRITKKETHTHQINAYTKCITKHNQSAWRKALTIFNGVWDWIIPVGNGCNFAFDGSNMKNSNCYSDAVAVFHTRSAAAVPCYQCWLLVVGCRCSRLLQK